jgi:hypothetical protein
LNELLINLIDLILMILSHQSLNNLDVVIILLCIKVAYACKLARSSQSFSHSFVRSLSVRSFFFRSFSVFSFSLVLYSLTLFLLFRFSVCLSQDSRLNRKKIIKTFV